MGERSRVHLPALGAYVRSAGPPTIESARAALGGTATGTRPLSRVEVDRGRGRRAEGLVVHATEAEIDVWIGDGVFARLRAPDRPIPLSRPSPSLDAALVDLARFAALTVGQPVRAERPWAPVEGRVLELCRYGALVEADGKVLAVGLRALHPR